MSEVSSLQSMQTSLGDVLQTSLASTQMANGAALIGTTVLAPTSEGTPSSASGRRDFAGAVQAPSGATSVTVTRSRTPPARRGRPPSRSCHRPSSGTDLILSWDGTTSTGSALPPRDSYTVSGFFNATVNERLDQSVSPLVVEPGGERDDRLLSTSAAGCEHHRKRHRAA
jgi:flagellar hook assembly protein FlgD